MNIKLSLEEKSAQVLNSFRFGKTEISDYCIQHGWGGIQLSIWDYKTFAGARATIEDFRRRSKIPPFITTDTEGGLGATLDEATEFPGLMAIGATGDPGLAAAVARATALECAAIGLSWSFCPVADVNTYPFNPSTNVRSYGTDPETVSRFVEAHIRAYRDNGLVSTAKHFPGQGDSRKNSHYELERIVRGRDEMDQCELVPFRRAFAAGVETVMTNHAIYPAYDDVEPASFSRELLTNLLRVQMGFKGIVITDCLEMKAIKDHYSVEESVTKSLLAGCDIVLTENDCEKSLFAVVNGVKKGIISERMLDERVEKIIALKEKYGLFKPLQAPALSLQEHRKLAETIARKSVKIARNAKSLLPLGLPADQQLLLIVPEKNEKLNIGVHSSEKDMARYMRKYHPHLVERRIPLAVSPATRDELGRAAAASGAVIFDASFRLPSGQSCILSPKQIELLKHLHGKNGRLIVLGFNPFIISQIPFVDAIIFTYGRNEFVLNRAAELVFEEN